MIHEIKIKVALNGYIANVGCQTLVFNDRGVMLKELDSYLDKPHETEKRYRETAVNRELLANMPCPTPTPPQGMAAACEDAAPPERPLTASEANIGARCVRPHPATTGLMSGRLA
jgi:hypothetical protein